MIDQTLSLVWAIYAQNTMFFTLEKPGVACICCFIPLLRLHSSELDAHDIVKYQGGDWK